MEYFKQATAIVVGFVIFSFCSNVFSQNLDEEKEVEVRKIQYPLKTQSLIYTKEDIQRAKEKITNNKEAQKIASTIIESAEKWISWEDTELVKLIPDAKVPRSFDVSVSGCPIHGDKVFLNGRYTWILDPKKPFKIECPIGHETYPSNDFQSDYKTGFRKAVDHSEKYVDDGWGWEDSDGEKYWFVAYANQWMLLNYIRPAIRDLGRAYLITGRKEFAHKALVLLHRLAEVYPSMDYENQSRYGQMQKKNGRRYPGKVLNLIWECIFIEDVVESYDAVWSHVYQDSLLQQMVSKSGKEIQAFIEANLLEEAVESYQEGKIRGNFGMHQIALVNILLARQNMDNEKFVDIIINNASKNYNQTGVKYAFYNLVFRDGIPMESPSYNMLWIRSLTKLGHKLKKLGVNIFEMDRMKSILESPMKMCVVNKYTVDVGDSGSILGGVLGRDKDTYERAYMNYKDSMFLDWISPEYLKPKNEEKSVISFDNDFESLFRPDFDMTGEWSESGENYSSRLLAGYGLGILEDEKQENAIALTYGMHGSHYHWDFLNFELFANGQKMIPDFGYPDAMNSYVPEVYTWSKNTSSHNTVVVDARKQDRNLPGSLHDFSTGKYVKTMDASSPAYSGLDTYRRHLVMVHAGPKQSYVVDFFKIKGGNRHDYILHGPPGDVEFESSEWGEVLPGTYAGEKVSLGEIYDNEEMNDPHYSKGYSGYAGSGFQHLFNVQKKIKGNGILNFRHVNDGNARIKLRVLPAEGQQLYVADAYDLPKTRNFLIKHIICHSENKDEPLKNTFVSILEPYSKEEFISSAKRLEFAKGSPWSHAVSVTRGYETDIIISDSEGLDKILEEPSLKTDAKTAVVTLNQDGELVRAFFSDGTYLSMGQHRFTSHELRGQVSGVDYENKMFTIQLDKETTLSEMETLNKEIVFFPDPNHMTEHPVSTLDVKGDKLQIHSNDDLIIGYINVSKTIDQDQVLESNNALIFEETYVGAYILNEEYEPVGKVKSIEGGKIEFSGDRNKIFNGSETANIWIANIGIGDQTVLKTKFEWDRND